MSIAPPRLSRRKSALSFALAAVLLFFALKGSGIHLQDVWSELSTVSLPLYLFAMVLFYGLFPLRVWRWRVMLRNAEQPVDTPESRASWSSLWHLLEVMWLSWFSNAVLPARLGDFYRAHLLERGANVPFSLGLGTVFAERILDLLLLGSLSLVCGFLSLRLLRPEDGTLILAVSGVGVLLLSLGLWVLFRHDKLLQRLLPQRFVDAWQRFRLGLFTAFAQKSLGLMFLATIAIWLGEGIRLWLVVQALGEELPMSAAIFIALLGSLLTSLPFLPGGLGLTELGITGALVLFGFVRSQAFAVATLDRLINYGSVTLIGFGIYLFGQKRRRALL